MTNNAPEQESENTFRGLLSAFYGPIRSVRNAKRTIAQVGWLSIILSGLLSLYILEISLKANEGELIDVGFAYVLLWNYVVVASAAFLTLTQNRLAAVLLFLLCLLPMGVSIEAVMEPPRPEALGFDVRLRPFMYCVVVLFGIWVYLDLRVLLAAWRLPKLRAASGESEASD